MESMEGIDRLHPSLDQFRHQIDQKKLDVIQKLSILSMQLETAIISAGTVPQRTLIKVEAKDLRSEKTLDEMCKNFSEKIVQSLELLKRRELSQKKESEKAGKYENILGIFRGLMKDGLEDTLEALDVITETISSVYDISRHCFFLDKSRFLTGALGDRPIVERHREWFLNEALLLEAMEKSDGATKAKLGLAILQGYSKAALVSDEYARDLGLQVSPIFGEKIFYHRALNNPVLEKICELYAAKMGLNPSEIAIVDSPLLLEALPREFPGTYYQIDTQQRLEEVIDQLFESAKQGVFPDNAILLDCTRFLAVTVPDGGDIASFSLQLKEIIEKKFGQFVQDNPLISIDEIADSLLSNLNLIACTKFQDQTVLLLNPADFNGGEGVGIVLRDMVTRSGFLPSLDEAKKAWIKIHKNPEDILREESIPLARLSTHESKIPMISSTIEQFMSQPVVTKFQNLSFDAKSPYLQILPRVTVDLLRGLGELHIESFFEKDSLRDLLQISLFRIQNAMNEAIFRKDDPIAFYNQIELIHQEMQTILNIAEPYEAEEFASCIIKKLTGGDAPVVSERLPEPLVHLKASGMRGVCSVLASVERQKGDNHLTVAVLKDSYYESSENIHGAATYAVHKLDGDVFDAEGVETAFSDPPQHPIDLFICEFHHNISETRQVYKTENLLGQVKAMAEKGMLAEKCTILIDTTIDLEESDDLRTFLSDPTIERLIKEGKLNIALVRSAQKFDMIGLDNYSGGITIAINDHDSFGEFNSRMADPQDQLSGLSYQGLTHIQKYAGKGLDQYRAGLMENTRKLYEMLPKGMIFAEGTEAPFQISRREDPRGIFLDVKTPLGERVLEAFSRRFAKFAQDERHPVTSRASFGFPTTNYIFIREISCFRITPGLEDEGRLERYAVFFQALQDAVDRVTAQFQGEPDDLAEQIVQAIETLEIPGHEPVMNLSSCEVLEIDDPAHMRKILQSMQPNSDLTPDINSAEDFEELMRTTIKKIMEGSSRENDIMIDCTKYFSHTEKRPEDLSKMVLHFEKILRECLELEFGQNARPVG